MYINYRLYQRAEVGYCKKGGLATGVALLNKIAVVTGGSRGIGRAIALRVAKDGYILGVHFGSKAQEAEQTVATIKDQGGRAFAFQTDLSQAEVGIAFWSAYDGALSGSGYSGGNLYLIVNNAGVTLRSPIEEFSAHDFMTQQAINVSAPYFIVKEGLSRIADGGRIINISSGVTRIAFPEIIAYAMTKGAIDTFTRTLAKHLGPRGITVNAVAPGVVDTDINAAWLRDNAAAIKAVSESSALGRVGQPNDIAGVVAFLASEDGGWVTGQIIDATGGTHL